MDQDGWWRVGGVETLPVYVYTNLVLVLRVIWEGGVVDVDVRKACWMRKCRGGFWWCFCFVV